MDCRADDGHVARRAGGDDKLESVLEIKRRQAMPLGGMVSGLQ